MEDRKEIIRALTLLDEESTNVPLFKFHIAIDNMILHRCDVILADYLFMYELTVSTNNMFLYHTHTIPEIIELLDFMPPEFASLEVYEIEETKRNLSFIEDLIIDNKDIGGLL